MEDKEEIKFGGTSLQVGDSDPITIEEEPDRVERKKRAAELKSFVSSLK